MSQSSIDDQEMPLVAHLTELRSRLQALQSRIRPHFLFNSLNSIASLIEVAPAKAEQAVLDLSDLFRANLSSSEALSCWGEERRLCEGYLRIEQYRLGERLRVQWDVAELPDTLPIPLRYPPFRLFTYSNNNNLQFFKFATPKKIFLVA